MVNETTVVQSRVPAHLIRDAHRTALLGCGFCCAGAQRGAVNFIAENPQPLLPQRESFVALADAERRSPGSDPFRSRLLQAMNEQGQVEWVKVLEGILLDLPAVVPYLDVAGAIWSLTPGCGGVGGYAMRIGRDGIQSVNTEEWLQRLPVDVDRGRPLEDCDDLLYLNGTKGYFAEVSRGRLVSQLGVLVNLSRSHALSEVRTELWQSGEEGCAWVAEPGLVLSVFGTELVVGTDSFHVTATSRQGITLRSMAVPFDELRTGLEVGERLFGGTAAQRENLRSQVMAHCAIDQESFDSRIATNRGALVPGLR